MRLRSFLVALALMGCAAPPGDDLALGSSPLGLARPYVLDTTFADEGVLRGLEMYTRSAVDPSSRVVTLDVTEGWLVFRRYRADGSRDADFGRGGVRYVTPPVGYLWQRTGRRPAITTDPAGRALAVVELRERDATTSERVAVVRLTAAGAIDTSFHTDGIAIVGTGTRFFLPRAVVDSASRVVLVGEDLDDDALVFRRLATSGSLDTTFGRRGIVRVPNERAHLFSLLVDASGRIVTASNTTVGGWQLTRLVRLEGTGALDPTFGTGGIATLDRWGLQLDGTELLEATDGRYLILLSYHGWEYDEAYVRALLPDGSPDPLMPRPHLIEGADRPVDCAIGSGRLVCATYEWDLGACLLELDASTGEPVAAPIPIDAGYLAVPEVFADRGGRILAAPPRSLHRFRRDGLVSEPPLERSL